MILSKAELQHYRALVGIQFQYMLDRDSHKVVEIHLLLMQHISGVLRRMILEKTGVDMNPEWSVEAKNKFGRMCIDAAVAADDGWEAWSKKHLEIERWISAYIEGGLLQATVSPPNIIEKN